MLDLGIFKKKQKITIAPDDESLRAVFDMVDKSSVPLSGNAIFRLTQLGATNIDECLQRLVDKDWLEIAYEKNGLDGISRQYYKVSEKYNLLDVKEKVSNFITSVIRKAKPVVANDHSYFVKVPGHSGFNTNFDVRQDARDYKRLLRDSRMKLVAEIWEVSFEDGVQTEERKVS